MTDISLVNLRVLHQPRDLCNHNALKTVAAVPRMVGMPTGHGLARERSGPAPNGSAALSQPHADDIRMAA